MTNSPASINEETFHLFIQTNSPGELASWVIPFVQVAKKNTPNLSVTLLLTPCQYASGKEKQVALNSDLFTKVYDPQETIKLLRSLPWFKKIYQKGAVLYLGGDILFSKLFSLKYRLPLFAHFEQTPFKLSNFMTRKIFTKGEYGDLMYTRIAQSKFDRQTILKKYNLTDQRYCLFFCGSRKEHFLNFTPLVADAIHYIKTLDPSFNPLLQISPFITTAELKQAQTTSQNLPVLQGNSLELLSIADLLVCLPGTSTAEAMYMGVPMLVVLPLNKPEVLIFNGLLGLVGKLPYLGLALKKVVIAYLKPKKLSFSIPNRMAKKEIIPELVTSLDTEGKILGDSILNLLNNPPKLAEIRHNLNQMPKHPDTAQKIWTEILRLS